MGTTDLGIDVKARPTTRYKILKRMVDRSHFPSPPLLLSLSYGHSLPHRHSLTHTLVLRLPLCPYTGSLFPRNWTEYQETGSVRAGLMIYVKAHIISGWCSDVFFRKEKRAYQALLVKLIKKDPVPTTFLRRKFPRDSIRRIQFNSWDVVLRY